MHESFVFVDKGKVIDQSPWTVLGGVDWIAAVVLRETAREIGRAANVVVDFSLATFRWRVTFQNVYLVHA